MLFIKCSVNTYFDNNTIVMCCNQLTDLHSNHYTNNCQLQNYNEVFSTLTQIDSFS